MQNNAFSIYLCFFVGKYVENDNNVKLKNDHYKLLKFITLLSNSGHCKSTEG